MTRRRHVLVGGLVVLLAGGRTAFSSPSLGSTDRVSVDQAGGDADGGSFWPSISADGRFVAFASDADDLALPVGNPSYPDVFRRDLTTGSTVLVSVDMDG